MQKTKRFKNIDEYIKSFPKDTAGKLKVLRETIAKHAPGAQEVISYNMPAFKLNGILVYFAGFEKHIGFYPYASSIQHFKKNLVKYKTSKGTIQFPLKKKIPVGLVQKIVKFRVKERLGK